jgi:hypothetical protein
VRGRHDLCDRPRLTNASTDKHAEPNSDANTDKHAEPNSDANTDDHAHADGIRDTRARRL